MSSLPYDHNRLYPGGASPDRPDIARPAPVARGLSDIESRWILLRQGVISGDPALRAFMEQDVATLLAIARAASEWAKANNAEKSRQAAERIHAALRGA